MSTNINSFSCIRTGSIPFRIVFHSSEDRKNPVQALIPIVVLPGKLSKESPVVPSYWLSASGSSYPETLILSFDKVVHLTQVQLLSHEFAIASKVELYVSEFPVTSIVGPVDQLEFKRLGHFSLDSNERSNWQSRELKSVFVNVSAGLLKLVLHTPHKNRLNSRHQVGIVSVRCMGEFGEDISETPSTAQFTGVDQATRLLIDTCEYERKKAINDINPEEANALQVRIDSLIKSGAEILILEAQKQQAVVVENYDEAKRLKFEIERVRQSQNSSFVDKISSLWKLQNSVPQVDILDPIEIPSLTDTASDGISGFSSDPFMATEPLPKPEPLPSYFERDYPDLLESLGKDLVGLLMSKDWRLRERGLASVLANSVSDSTLDYGVAWCIRKLITDKIVNIYLAVCELIKACQFSAAFSEDYEMAFVQMVEHRIADSNKRVVDTTVSTIMSMVPRLVPVNTACHYLFKGPFSKQTVHVRAHIFVGLLETVSLHLDPLVATLGEWAESSIHSDSIVVILKKVISVFGSKKLELSINTLPDKRRNNLLHELKKTEPIARTASERLGQCEFCQQTDSKFLIPEQLDRHYWKNCPNLIECHFCEQIVELTALSEHRLKECQT